MSIHCRISLDYKIHLLIKKNQIKSSFLLLSKLETFVKVKFACKLCKILANFCNCQIEACLNPLLLASILYLDQSEELILAWSLAEEGSLDIFFELKEINLAFL